MDNGSNWLDYWLYQVSQQSRTISLAPLTNKTLLPLQLTTLDILFRLPLKGNLTVVGYFYLKCSYSTPVFSMNLRRASSVADPLG